MDLTDLILAALDRNEIPKRVPSFVQGIMPGFYDQWKAKYRKGLNSEYVIRTMTKDITLHVHLGFDSSWCHFGGPWQKAPHRRLRKIKKRALKALPKEERAKGYYIGNYGGLYRKTVHQGYDHNYLVRGVIKTEEQWNEWFNDGHWDIHPSPVDSVKVYNRSMKKCLESKHPHLLMPTCGLIMEPLLGMIDLGRMSYFARKKPAFFHKVTKFIMTPKIEKFKLMCESNAPVLIVPDDCAYKMRPILSPKHFREFIIPYWKQLAGMAHKAGKLIMMHSDGVVEPYYADLIEAGVDIHQSVEPAAGNDLGHIMEKWGDKMSFVGNVDSSRLLAFATPEEVARVTELTLKVGMSGNSGNGYMFSPCTDLINLDTLANVESMMATWRKFSSFS